MRIQDAQRVTQRQEHSDNIQSITAALTNENNTVKLIHGLINTPLAFDLSQSSIRYERNLFHLDIVELLRLGKERGK